MSFLLPSSSTRPSRVVAIAAAGVGAAYAAVQTVTATVPVLEVKVAFEKNGVI